MLHVAGPIGGGIVVVGALAFTAFEATLCWRRRRSRWRRDHETEQERTTRELLEWQAQFNLKRKVVRADSLDCSGTRKSSPGEVVPSPTRAALDASAMDTLAITKQDSNASARAGEKRIRSSAGALEVRAVKARSGFNLACRSLDHCIAHVCGARRHRALAGTGAAQLPELQAAPAAMSSLASAAATRLPLRSFGE